MSTLRRVELGPGLGSGLSFWAPSESEARWVYEEIFEHGCYSGLALPEEAFIVDVGANIGLFSYFIRQQRPRAEILAFEPMPETLKALRRNADLHGFADVRIEECALGAEHEERVEFTFYPLLPGNSTRYPEEKELQRSVMVEFEPPEQVVRGLTGHPVAAEVHRLSTFLAAGRDVDLLKIDVEGAELDVLRGIDDEHWPLIQHVVLEAQDLGGRLAAIRTLLAGRGFTVDVQPAPMIPAAVKTFVVRATR